jgi:hypothetical protein
VHIKVLYFLDREIVEHDLTLEYGELVLQLLVYLHIIFHTFFGHYVLFVLSSQLQERGIEADRFLEELFIEHQQPAMFPLLRGVLDELVELIKGLSHWPA